jgi:hypothetical protein
MLSRCAELGKLRKERQACRENVCGRHGTGADEVRHRYN